MSVSTLGDLAQSFVTRRANARLGRELATLGTELTTGLKSDVRSAVSGDAGMIGGIERSLTRITAFGAAAREASIRAGVVQGSLGRIQDEIGLILPDLMSGGTEAGPARPAVTRANADGAFRTIVSSLNSTSAGAFVFSGTETGTAPLRDADAILADLETLVGGAPDSETMIARIDDYFSETGAFVTGDYLGGTTSLAPVEIAEGVRAGTDLRADDSSLRETLAAIAKARFAASGAFDDQSGDYRNVVANAADQLRGSHDAITDRRAAVGATEARIEAAITRNASEDTALQQARTDLIGVDRYETATRIKETELQLETLYTITARLSRLSLTNYL